LLVVGAGALALLALLLTLSGSASAATIHVEIKNFQFSPKDLQVNVGDNVEWMNHDGVGHDVTFEAGFGSGSIAGIAPGGMWNYTFNTAGSFRYRCQAHSSDFAGGMIGSVVVIDPALYPRAAVLSAPSAPVPAGTTVTLSGNATDGTGVAGVFVQVDASAPVAATVTEITAGDARAVNWTFNVTGLLAGSHTVKVWAQNGGGYNSTAVTPVSIAISVAAAGGGGGAPSGNPFGETFLFEDILTKYFWLITGISVILLAVIMMFLSYSGKLQNYYITLLTALDERHRLFAFTRPTREFIYTIQRQMPRTHTERYNLKVIWYWYPLYCLGGLSFAAFIIETITGIILGFYYIPEGTGPNEGLPSQAYQSMETIMTKVTFGYIFRALHHWGAHMMVAAVFLHMMRVYFVGAYKNPRELNWLLGAVLINVVLLFGYTGYLLPWDQLSFWAGQIGLEMAYTIPVVGEIIGNMIFGGPELSGATIIRMYYLHVFVLPLVGGGLMVLHMGIVWMQGVAEPH
jgi:plastocyanin